MEGVCPLVEHPLLQSKLCHVHDWTIENTTVFDFINTW